MNTSCNKAWSRQFLRASFTSAFLNTRYKNHLETLLFDKERALLPATQHLVEIAIQKEKLTNEISELDKLIRDLTSRRARLREVLMNLDNPNVGAGAGGGATAGGGAAGGGATADGAAGGGAASTCFVRACPAAECRGYLDKTWTCGLCKLATCSKCHELLPGESEEHTCDPNSVETAALLKNDSKPCPCCHSLIFKINGCDQMWCTQCHTAFSWKTGALEKNIHNPHFYEWQRKNGGVPRAEGDVQCGQELTHHVVGELRDLSRTKHTNLNHSAYSSHGVNVNVDPNKRTFNRLCGSIRELIDLHLVRELRFRTNDVEQNQHLRIKYMRNLLTEQEFKTALQKNSKNNQKNAEILRVTQLIRTVMTDIIFRAIDHLRTADANEYTLGWVDGEMDELLKYGNSLFKDISFAYNSVCYEFGWSCFMTTSKTVKG